MVKFEDEEDYTYALLNGPWTIFGHYLLVQPWNPSFNSDDNDLSMVTAWIRFPGLPLQYYHKSFLRAIAISISRPLKIDYNTQEGLRGHFARMAVELDLRKPLVSYIKINGRKQDVEYESLLVICYCCGQYGHNLKLCPFQ